MLFIGARRSIALVSCSLAFALTLLGGTPGQLSIHAINVGWGSSVLVEGPTGKHMLLDAGNVGKGTSAVVPYLHAEGIASLDVIVLSHNHQDHSGGLSEVASAGFTAPLNYFNGSTGGSSTALTWESSVGATAITPGTVIDLGGGATATCIAANGHVLGQATNYSGGDENDNSVALLIQFGGFKYIWEGDLGGAADREDTCSGRTTSQVNVEVPMIRAILPGGSHPLIPSQGVDIIHVGHHGSMSSTHPVYVNLTAPTVALINTGSGQSSTWALPYTATVDNVLLGGTNGCAGVPAPLVLQTEDGDMNYNNKRSTSGYAVGNIKVRTDGNHFWVSSNSDNGNVPYIAADDLTTERQNAGLPLGTERVFTVHNPSGGSNTVTATISVPSTNVTLASGATQAFTGSATDSGSEATLSYSWNFGDGNSATSASASHAFINTGTSAATYTVTFTASDQTSASGTATRVITVSPATSGGAVFNEVEPNNTQATANAVPDSATSIVGYFKSTSDNDDYYNVTLLAGHTLTVDMTGPATGQNYDLYLYSSGGTLLASSLNTGTTEHMSYKNTNISATKTLSIRVHRTTSYSSTTPYKLTLSR
jgi:beta-lactamase superfamily II metal-dependent hydrolase/PKD repeat protein